MTQLRQKIKPDADVLVAKQKKIVIGITIITILLVWVLARSVTDPQTTAMQSPDTPVSDNKTPSLANKENPHKNAGISPENKTDGQKQEKPKSNIPSPEKEKTPVYVSIGAPSEKGKTQPPSTANDKEQPPVAKSVVTVENKTEQLRLSFWKNWSDSIRNKQKNITVGDINLGTKSIAEPLRIIIPLGLSELAKIEIILKPQAKITKIKKNNTDKVTGQLNASTGLAINYEDVFTFMVRDGGLVIERIKGVGNATQQFEQLTKLTGEVERYVINGKSYCPDFTPGESGQLETGSGNFTINKDGTLQVAYRLTDDDKLAKLSSFKLESQCEGYKLIDELKFNQDILKFQFIGDKLALARIDFEKNFKEPMVNMKKMLSKQDKLTTDEYLIICKWLDPVQSKLKFKNYTTSREDAVIAEINNFKDHRKNLISNAKDLRDTAVILRLSPIDTTGDSSKICERLQAYLKNRPESLSAQDYKICRETVNKYISARDSFVQSCISIQEKVETILSSGTSKYEREKLQAEHGRTSLLKAKMLVNGNVVKEINFERFGNQSADDNQ